MKRSFFVSHVYCLWILASQFSHAIVDQNQNGLSDLWEKRYNQGYLLPAGFDPTADSDGDGYLNSQEAIAGTDPFHQEPLDGRFTSGITHYPATYQVNPDDPTGPLILATPDSFLIDWNAQVGKQYQLEISRDLESGSWLTMGESITATNSEIQMPIAPTYEDGSLPGALFWRAAVSDVDTDGDSFTDYEENLLHTDPNIADRDADGIPDVWEAAFGLDPQDNGSSNFIYGPDGDPDQDGFTNAEEYAAGTDPLNFGSKPGGGGLQSPTIGLPPSLNVEYVSCSANKTGFRGYQGAPNNPDWRRYYLQSVSEAYTAPSPSNGAGGSSTTTSLVDMVTGDITSHYSQTGEGSYPDVGGWNILSETTRSATGTAQGESETETLSNEFTTQLLIAYAESLLPQFNGSFTESGSALPSYSIYPEPGAYADYYGYSKVRYKWDTHKDSILEGENVNWLEVFYPQDEGPEIIKAKFWKNSLRADTSPVYEIDPKQENGGQHGSYATYRIEFEVDEPEDITDGWDTTEANPCLSVGVGKTSSIPKLVFGWMPDSVIERLELVVDPASKAYVKIANITLDEVTRRFDVVGIKATTSDAGCKIHLKIKGTNTIVATLQVNVFEEITIPVAIYTVHDSNNLASAIGPRTKTDQDIISALNGVYGDQANLKFTLASSQDLDLSTDPNYAFAFTTQGKFIYDSLHYQVFLKAKVPPKTLPIFIVKELQNPAFVGMTNFAMTYCFSNNDPRLDDICAHEVGHYLNLSTVKKGQASAHDLGPWPEELIWSNGAAFQGLMSDGGVILQTYWLRRKDWVEASKQAKLRFK